MRLTLTDLIKNYDKRILDGISLHIEDYDAIAIIGRSGCGKSTLLRLLTGIEKADSGFISVNDHAIQGKTIRKYQDTVSVVFQQHNLFPHLTVLQNVELILQRIRGVPKDEATERAERILRQLHLEEAMHKRPRFISGGQAQRASIARALATEPEIIFMDEPTAALDPVLTKEVLDAVSELRASGTKFIFVTHEIAFVRQFADYVVFMEGGKIAEHGPASILDQPETSELQLFLKHERQMSI